MITDYMEKNGLFDIDFDNLLKLLEEIDNEEIDNDFWENDLKEEDFDE